METKDLIIVGAGPAGLAAAIYALERKLHLIVLESHRVGGQLVNLYADKNIYDLPTYKAIKARDLARLMQEHACEAGAEIILDTEVKKIVKQEKTFRVNTSFDEHVARCVILATGMGYYTARRLHVVGEDFYENKGVYFQKLPQEKLTGKRIVVVGGGDTAIETAVRAAEQGAAVTVIHRSPTFRAQEKTVEKAKSLDVRLLTSSQVTEIKGSDRLETVAIVRVGTAESLLSAHLVIICIGVELTTSFVGQLGVRVDRQAVVVDADMQTSVSGLFACGDVTVPAGKYKRISVAFGTAATAVNGVYHYLKKPYWDGKK